MIHRTRSTWFLLSALLVGASGVARAQQDSLEPVRSLGQPARWKPYYGGFVGFNDLANESKVGGLGVLGLYRDVLPPVAGVGVMGEGYLGSLGDGVDGGLRAAAFIPAFFLHFGLDYAFGLDQLDFMVGLNAPLRRGGILGNGSRVRLDWLPGRGQTLNLGVTMPIRQGPMGETRPKSHKVAVPRAERRVPGALGAAEAGRARALAEMQRSQGWILTAASLLYRDKGETHAAALASQRERIARFLDSAVVVDPLRPAGRSYEAELALWHEQMAVAFAHAVGAPGEAMAARGREIAASARRALLDGILLPYDVLFGQHKDPPDLFGLAASAREQFGAALPTELAPDARARLLDTFDRIVVMIEGHRVAMLALEDGDSRYGWLPLQFALLPEEYDSQAELNQLIARLAGRPFVGGNRLAYVAGAQFRAVLKRQLASARHFHVLWIHDFPGLTDGGRPDTVAFNATMAYLKALTAAAQGYDARGRFPQYYIFLDEHYYDARRSRMWMTILERPLHERIQLPAGYEGMATMLRAQQDSLRAAVAASTRLQEAARSRGRKWIDGVVKVHVNITHPADPSFISSHMVVGLPFVPDNIARDHRKLAFMDLSPDHPDSGSAILAGVGVGENYANTSWDDRAIAISGPAALSLLDEVQRLLRRNGFSDEQIPAVFKAGPGVVARPEPVDALTTGVLIASNDVGFGVKAASAVQMGLLTLMPAGSLIYIPDSIWTSMIYASELVVAALRGCHVRIVAPSLANAPSAAAPTMARTWDLFTRLLELELGLRDKLKSRHGDLRVGFYRRQARLDDPSALLREVADGLERESWLVDELNLRGSPPALRALADSLERRPLKAGRAIQDTLSRSPRLHAKTQLFLTGPAWRGLLSERRLNPLLDAEMLPTVGLELPMDRVGMPEGSDEVMALAARAAERLDVERAGAAMFLTGGSQNKDLRSMLLDGEMKAVIAGPKALIGLLEFVHILGLTRFPESQEELEQLMPPWSESTRSLAYKIRRAL